jgi:outer membrane protein OmpA-like peptidoglycan-associated protein
MNYPINSTNDDMGLIYEDNDTIGYFSSNRNGVDRIYKFITKPTGRVFIDGTVMSPDGTPLEGATVKLMDAKTGEVLEELMTGVDGKFDFELEADKNYRIESSKEGYFTESYDRSTVGQTKDEDEELIFTMRELLVTDPEGPYDPTGDNVYSVDNIYYDYNMADIRPDAAIELDKLVKLMKDNPSISIELQSHTDARGEDAYNLDLSKRRAASARKYIVGKGVSSERIASKGFGETRIINDCTNDVECSEEQHEKNRRTEFIVTEIKE